MRGVDACRSAVLCAAAFAGCTSMITNGTPQGDAGGDGVADGAAELGPFECDLPDATPTLEPVHWLHPAAPRAGQTVTVSLQSQNTEPGSAPSLVAEITNREGARQVSEYALVGGGKALYYISFGDIAQGQNCIVIRDGDNVEAAIKVDAASSAAGVERGGGVWKVTRNHQWRCDEQPTWGNLLTVKATDEEGAPLAGVTIDVDWTDDTVFPVGPDDDAMNYDDHGQPKSLVTGDDGTAALTTPWGEGVRSPIDARPGYVVYLLSVADGASDVATEISTGMWETNQEGCNYCSIGAVNVYGHWSHTVEFQRRPDATEVCEVPSDHEGQKACSYSHYYHEEGRESCWPVAP